MHTYRLGYVSLTVTMFWNYRFDSKLRDWLHHNVLVFTKREAKWDSNVRGTSRLQIIYKPLRTVDLIVGCKLVSVSMKQVCIDICIRLFKQKAISYRNNNIQHFPYDQVKNTLTVDVYDWKCVLWKLENWNLHESHFLRQSINKCKIELQLLFNWKL